MWNGEWVEKMAAASRAPKTSSTSTTLTTVSATTLQSATERFREISDLPFCRYVSQMLALMHAKFERNRDDGRRVGALVFLFIFGSGGCSFSRGPAA